MSRYTSRSTIWKSVRRETELNRLDLRSQFGTQLTAFTFYPLIYRTTSVYRPGSTELRIIYRGIEMFKHSMNIYHRQLDG
ncbi:hypothetical protein VTO42DRAFT_1246 [Malbranchea cinnamomea]